MGNGKKNYFYISMKLGKETVWWGERERFIWENILNHAMREFYRYGDINYVEFN